MNEWKTLPDSPGFWWAYDNDAEAHEDIPCSLWIVQRRAGGRLWFAGNVGNAASGFAACDAEATRTPVGEESESTTMFLKMSPERPNPITTKELGKP